MNESFEITTSETSDRVSVMRVRGVLDAETSPDLISRCQEIAAGGRHLVLTLADVTFMSSTGVGALMLASEAFKKADRQLRFADLPPSLTATISLLNLDMYLTIDASEQLALASLDA